MAKKSAALENKWPASLVETWQLDAIKPYERNPREHPEAQINLLSRLMLKYGVDQPIVVDEQGVILKGHGRRLAALKAGFKEFPVVIHRGLDETEKRGLRVADNKVQLLAGWDETLLRLEIDDLKLNGFDIDFLGFDEKELLTINPGGFLADIVGAQQDVQESSAVVAGARGVALKFDMMAPDRDRVIAWLAHERDARKLRTTAEALIALANEALGNSK
jgi:ParB-like chromosome segregation protein Spo0J